MHEPFSGQRPEDHYEGLVKPRLLELVADMGAKATDSTMHWKNVIRFPIERTRPPTPENLVA